MALTDKAPRESLKNQLTTPVKKSKNQSFAYSHNDDMDLDDLNDGTNKDRSKMDNTSKRSLDETSLKEETLSLNKVYTEQQAKKNVKEKVKSRFLPKNAPDVYK